MSEEEGRSISVFEKFLTVWVALCIVIGILFSLLIPGISEVINSFSIGQIPQC